MRNQYGNASWCEKEWSYSRPRSRQYRTYVVILSMELEINSPYSIISSAPSLGVSHQGTTDPLGGCHYLVFDVFELDA